MHYVRLVHELLRQTQQAAQAETEAAQASDGAGSRRQTPPRDRLAALEEEARETEEDLLRQGILTPSKARFIPSVTARSYAPQDSAAPGSRSAALASRAATRKRTTASARTIHSRTRDALSSPRPRFFRTAS